MGEGSTLAAFGPASSTAERRQRLFDAAALVFARDGYSGSSMQAIATEIGITKAALYHYVRSKDELFFRVYDAYIMRLITEVGALTAQPPDIRLGSIVEILFHQVVAHRPYVRAFLQDLSKVESRQWASMIVARRDEFEGLVRKCLSDGIDQGLFSFPADPKLAAKFVLGACNWSSQWLDPSGPLTPLDLAGTWNALFAKAFSSNA